MLRFSIFLLIVCPAAVPPSIAAAEERPNVLFISVDDLNDWVSIFGGHPQAKTPNIDKLAKRGAVVFQNAHCAGPVCGSSRSALLSGFMPNRSGIYGNSQNMLAAPLIQQHATLPEYFAQHGYKTVSRGKIFHAHASPGGRDRGQWAFENWSPTESGSPVDKATLTSRDKNLIDGKPGPRSKFTQGHGSEFAWGVTRGSLQETSDFKTAKWAADQLAQDHDAPFFLAVGLSKPHLPFYSPQQFYDLYPLDSIKVNPILTNDLDDILRPDRKPKFKPSNDYMWLQESGLMEEVTQAYLACVSYADACVGEILDGLEKGPHAGNTIVVLWGDHGWHLGEKVRFRKATGWLESTRLPLVIRTPKMTHHQDCGRPVNLIDLYPTLIDYCGLPAKQEIDGKSLMPLLREPQAKWHETTLTIFGPGNASVVSSRWHLISHKDGTEEIYDLQADPQEWNNLANNASDVVKDAKKRLAAYIPTTFAPAIQKSDPAWKKTARRIDATLKVKRDLSKLK